MSSTPHILVVDDDGETRRLLRRYLEPEGFRVSLADNARQFAERLATLKLDLVILDIRLPDASGLELCRQLRLRDAVLPVIFVTALRDDVDRVLGLDAGADDYICKPYNPRELLARIRAILRRVRALAALEIKPTAYRFLGYAVDGTHRTVVDAAGNHIALTGAEFELLLAFLERPGRVLSREQLLDIAQGRGAKLLDRSIDVLISRLRRKLSTNSAAVLLKTVRNRGYQFAAAVDRVPPAWSMDQAGGPAEVSDPS